MDSPQGAPDKCSLNLEADSLLTIALYAFKKSQISSLVPAIMTILTLLHDPQARRKHTPLP